MATLKKTEESLAKAIKDYIIPSTRENLGKVLTVLDDETISWEAMDGLPAQSEETNKKIVELMNLSAGEQQKRREKFAQDRKEIMQEYIYYSLGPLLDEQDIFAVWLEYEGWISSSTYQPKPRLCKWKDKVTSRDVRHLTWNIAKRMGMENGYKSETCGRFVKALFPDLCVKRDGSPCTDSYLSQNLLEEKPDDLIKIDKPEPHSIAFHFRNMEMKQAV